jgi:hypothetical protein
MAITRYSVEAECTTRYVYSYSVWEVTVTEYDYLTSPPVNAAFRTQLTGGELEFLMQFLREWLTGSKYASITRASPLTE